MSSVNQSTAHTHQPNKGHASARACAGPAMHLDKAPVDDVSLQLSHLVRLHLLKTGILHQVHNTIQVTWYIQQQTQEMSDEPVAAALAGHGYLAPAGQQALPKLMLRLHQHAELLCSECTVMLLSLVRCVHHCSRLRRCNANFVLLRQHLTCKP
eukprot:GHRR01023258.1.p2 GENE.GHRR01023258.1~~GHRR01023258.1.p2  ORF type:complete len:154 (+),score=28.93 GHRR01023258.1:1032-1493(+)